MLLERRALDLPTGAGKLTPGGWPATAGMGRNVLPSSALIAAKGRVTSLVVPSRSSYQLRPTIPVSGSTSTLAKNWLAVLVLPSSLTRTGKLQVIPPSSECVRKMLVLSWLTALPTPLGDGASVQGE